MNIDNIMDELLDSSYNLEDISKAYQKACDRAATRAKEKEKVIADARLNVLQALRKYLIATFGECDEKLIKEFENELKAIEKSAVVQPKEKKSLSDEEKIRRFVNSLLLDY